MGPEGAAEKFKEISRAYEVCWVPHISQHHQQYHMQRMHEPSHGATIVKGSFFHP